MAVALATVQCRNSTSTAGAPSSGVLISGMVSKGPLSGGAVRVFSVNSAGLVDRELGLATTGADGRFALTVADPTEVLFLRATGGSYRDEATGVSVSLDSGDELTAAAVFADGTDSLAITPLTHFAVKVAQRRAGGLTADNARTALAQVARHFGLTDVLRVLPMDAGADGAAQGASTDAVQYGLALAGLSRYAEDLRTSTNPTLSDPFDLVNALARDVADGAFDGREPGGALGAGGISMSGGALPANAGTAGLGGALAAFSGDATRNRSGGALDASIAAGLGASDGKLVGVASIEITPGSPILAVGGTATLAASASAGAGTVIPGLVFDWTSSDSFVTAVDSTGRITALKEGAATITARTAGVDGTVTAVVLPPVSQLPKVQVSSAAPQETLAGETFTVLATGLNATSSAANAVIFPGPQGSGVFGISVPADPADNPDFDGTRFVVTVPADVADGDAFVRATYLLNGTLTQQDSAPIAITVLTADEAALRTPAVTGFTPDSAAAGETITLQGVNFLEGVTVALRDGSTPSEVTVLDAAQVTRQSFTELTFPLPASFAVGDGLELRAINPGGIGSDFFTSRLLQVTLPAAAPAPISEGLANLSLVATLERVSSSGTETVTFTFTLRDDQDAGLNGATVTLTSPSAGVVDIVTPLPNTDPGVYQATGLTYAAGEFYTLDAEIPAPVEGGAPGRYRRTLIAPGGSVTIPDDGLTTTWAFEGDNDTIVLFRDSTSGVSREITGPTHNGVADLTSPVTLTTADYDVGGGGSTGTFVVRVALRSMADIPSALAKSRMEILNTVERTITR